MKDASALLLQMPFSVLISDLNLPDGDGVELAREAKAMQKVKAIAITGRSADDDRAVALEAGFDCYLTKPINFADLKRALHSP